MEMLVGLFVLLAVVTVVAVSALLFCLWAVVGIARAVARLALRIVWPRQARRPAAGIQACRNPDCRGDNPEHARFCRRCGVPLPSTMRLVAVRAA